MSIFNRFYGIYDLSKPIIAIREPDIIRQIIVKDFEYFLDHQQLFPSENVAPLLTKSLLMLRGQKWRDMRTTLSPAFTGSKMRQMFQFIVECSEQTVQVLQKECNDTSSAYIPEMKDLFTRFTNDVIATSAFGIKVS